MLGTLATLALVFTMLIPAGFMPARAADGGIVVALCNGEGPMFARILPDGSVTVVADTGGDPRHDPAKGDPAKHGPCVFAGHAAPSAPVGSIALPPPPPSGFAAMPVARVRAAAPGRGMPAPPPPSHAPPVTII